MNQHTPEEQPWPWPTRDEAEHLASLLREADMRIAEHLHPEMIHVEHPDGRSMWATHFDTLPGEDLQFAPQLSPPSLIYPVIAETQDALMERVRAVVREARTYNMHLQPRSPLRSSPHGVAELKTLDDHVSALPRRNPLSDDGERPYSSEADLSFRVGKNVPRVSYIGGTTLRFPLPWPMTRAGGIMFVLVELAVVLGGIAGALWLGWVLFDPSIWRLLPAVVFALAVKLLLVPALHRFGRRPGMDRTGSGGS